MVTELLRCGTLAVLLAHMQLCSLSVANSNMCLSAMKQCYDITCASQQASCGFSFANTPVSFAACQNVTADLGWDMDVLWSIEDQGANSNFRGAIDAASSPDIQWAGFGFPAAGRVGMVGGSAIVVQACSTCPSGDTSTCPASTTCTHVCNMHSFPPQFSGCCITAVPGKVSWLKRYCLVW